MNQKLAIITGADGGMGTEITRAVASAGYKIVMACRDPQYGREKATDADAGNGKHGY